MSDKMRDMMQAIKGSPAEKLHDLGMAVGQICSVKRILEETIALGGLPQHISEVLERVYSELENLPLGKLSVEHVFKLHKQDRSI